MVLLLNEPDRNETIAQELRNLGIGIRVKIHAVAVRAPERPQIDEEAPLRVWPMPR